MIAGAMIGGGAGLASKGLEAGLNFASAHDAQQFAKKMYTNRFQWMMEDMRKAGLNPILAYREAGPGTPSASGGFQVPDMSGVGQSAIQAATAVAQLKNLQEQTRKTAAEADITEKNVPKAEIETEVWTRAKDLFDRAINWFDQGGSAKVQQDMRSLPEKAGDAWHNLSPIFTDAAEQTAKDLESGVGWLRRKLEAGASSAGSWLKEKAKEGSEEWRRDVEKLAPRSGKDAESRPGRPNSWRPKRGGLWEKQADGTWRRMR